MAAVVFPKVAASAWLCSSFNSSPSAKTLPSGECRSKPCRQSSRRNYVSLETLLLSLPSFTKLQKDQLQYLGESCRNSDFTMSKRKGECVDQASLGWNSKDAVLTGIEGTREGGILLKFGEMERLLPLDKLLSFLQDDDPGLENWLARASSVDHLISLLHEMLGVDTVLGKLKLSESFTSYLKLHQRTIDFEALSTGDMIRRVLASMTFTDNDVLAYGEASLITDFDTTSDSDWWRAFDSIFGLVSSSSGESERFSGSEFEGDNYVFRKGLKLLKEPNMVDRSVYHLPKLGLAKHLHDTSSTLYVDGTGTPAIVNRLESNLMLENDASTTKYKMWDSAEVESLPKFWLEEENNVSIMGFTRLDFASNESLPLPWLEERNGARLMEFTRLDFVRNESLPLPWLEKSTAEEAPKLLQVRSSEREAEIIGDVLELEKSIDVYVTNLDASEESLEVADVPQAALDIEENNSVIREEIAGVNVKVLKKSRNGPKWQKLINLKSTTSTRDRGAAKSRTRSHRDSFDLMTSYHSNSESAALGLLGMCQDYASELAGGLNQISVVLAGGGLACMLHVAALLLGMKPSLDFGKVVVLVRGCGLIWMSAAVRNLQRVLFASPKVISQIDNVGVMRVATELRHVSFKAFTFVILSIIISGL